MAGSQVEVAINQIEKQRLGYQAISLTNFDNDSEPQIAAGSKVEIGGALFEFTALESFTGWGAIGNNNDVFKKLVVAGTSVTAEFTTAPPTWSTSKQGWYVGLDRYIGGCYKDGSGNYTAKYLLLFTHMQGLSFLHITKTIEEGTENIAAGGGTWIIPKGLIQIVNPAAGVNDLMMLELYILGSWREGATSRERLIRSDGINMRIKNNGTDAGTIYYQRFN